MNQNKTKRHRSILSFFLFCSIMNFPLIAQNQNQATNGVTEMDATAPASGPQNTAISNYATSIAQEGAPASVPQREIDPIILSNYVETGGNYLPLTNNFGHWAGGYARSSITKGNNVWEGELNGQSEFGDSGVYFGGGDTFTINSSWYGSISAGSSVGGFFWPRFRTDEFINKKWLKQKQWITTFGFGYDAAKDPHRDHSLYFGSTYYFQRPWIVESGIRFNFSNPGNVFSPAGFIAITQGRNGSHYFTIRVGAGEEAYQLIGPTATLSDFKSQTLTIIWRQWAGEKWGINFIGDYYHNPFYSRGGPSIGLFRLF